MEMIGAELTNIVFYVLLGVIAASSAVTCVALLRLANICFLLVNEAADVSHEIKSIDARLTELAKSIISIEALMEREQARKTESSAGSDDNRVLRNVSM